MHSESKPTDVLKHRRAPESVQSSWTDKTLRGRVQPSSRTGALLQIISGLPFGTCIQGLVTRQQPQREETRLCQRRVPFWDPPRRRRPRYLVTSDQPPHCHTNQMIIGVISLRYELRTLQQPHCMQVVSFATGVEGEWATQDWPMSQSSE